MIDLRQEAMKECWRAMSDIVQKHGFTPQPILRTFIHDIYKIADL